MSTKKYPRTEVVREAEFSEDKKFRWWLRRRWSGGPNVCFVMLNPSVASDEIDDPTVRKCIALATTWGFGSVTVRNIYPYIATDPDDLFKAAKSIDITGGADGLRELMYAVASEAIIAAWGNRATNEGHLRAIARTAPNPLWCLDKNKYGSPKHPLYVANSVVPIGFRRTTKSWEDFLKGIRGL